MATYGLPRSTANASKSPAAFLVYTAGVALGTIGTAGVTVVTGSLPRSFRPQKATYYNFLGALPSNLQGGDIYISGNAPSYVWNLRIVNPTAAAIAGGTSPALEIYQD